MRCTACDCDMMLMKVAPAGAATLPGFEYHTFKCSTCRDVEQRLVLIRHGRETEADAMPTHDAPSIVPPGRAEGARPGDAQATTHGIFTRVLGRLGWTKLATPEPKADAPDLARDQSP